ncbi:MAG: hypothetical protein ACYDEA_01875 [Candidatus Dormibacteria bacterium]
MFFRRKSQDHPTCVPFCPLQKAVDELVEVVLDCRLALELGGADHTREIVPARDALAKVLQAGGHPDPVPVASFVAHAAGRALRDEASTEARIALECQLGIYPPLHHSWRDPLWDVVEQLDPRKYFRHYPTIEEFLERITWISVPVEHHDGPPA